MTTNATFAGTIRDDALFDLNRDDIERYPVGVITLDRAGAILAYNAAESAFSGLRPDEVIGRRFFGDVAPCTAVREFQGRFDAFAAGEGTAAERFDFTFSFRWGEQDVSIALLRRALRREIHMVVRVRSKERLAVPAEPAVGAQDEIEPGPVPFGVWERDERSGEMFASDELRRILGEPEGHAIRDGGVLAYVVPSDLEFVGTAEARSFAERREVRVRCSITGADGTARRVELQSATVRDEHGTPLRTFGAVVDLSRERRVWRNANFDSLTQLSNRRFFYERLAKLISGGTPVAVVYVDLDRFKQVNDSAGDDAGDVVLRMAAARLALAVRPGDLVARLHGDEFALAIVDVDAASARVIADAALRQIAVPFDVDGSFFELSASAGIAMWPNDGATVGELMRAADLAMFHAKRDRGHGTLLASASLRDAERREQADTDALRAAVRNGDITLLYQPIVEMTSRRIIGVEALARWTPEGTPVSPDHFIPLAERSGLIVELGGRLLARACRDAAAWHAAGVPLRLAVNVSAVQLRARGFLDSVRDALDDSGLPPTALELELTERIIVDRFDDLMATMTDLKVLGVELSVDDFGTGYSGLSYVKYFPLDTLKLDRSFVQGREALDDAIASTVVTLGRRLGLRVIAEGVETERQLQRSIEYGCTHAQGWLFARAVDADEVLEMTLGAR